MRDNASGAWARFAKSFAFNNAEAVVRIPIMALMVENLHISSVFATGITLILAFFVRFLFHSLVVYAPRKGATPVRARRIAESIDQEFVQPGEL
jgi:dolichol-phosphate mannosyltransferase